MAPLDIPISDAIARVQMIDTTGSIVVNAESFIEPSQRGHDFSSIPLNLPVAAFLIEHATSGKKVLFDLGTRVDYWNLPAIWQKLIINYAPGLRVDKDIKEILQEKGTALGDISSVVWSHYHWDHIGDMGLFPTATELVVGPGFKEHDVLFPGFPQNPNSPLNSDAIEGRTLTQVKFHDLQIGGLRAHDFFGDGSFYLLDTPGHCIGHLCGLVRTTGGPDSTFILLGGDSCHFPGCLRPNHNMHLPERTRDSIPNSDVSRSAPFYRVSTQPSSAYADPTEAQATLDKLINFDADASVMVCLAHDETCLHSLPTFNETPEDDLNQWKPRGFKDKIYWGWLNHLPGNSTSERQRSSGGFWRDGKPWPEANEVLRRNGEVASGLNI